MNKKYRLLENDTIMVNGNTLYRIRVIRDLANIHVGDLGGYIECERNLSHEGSAWVYGDANVSGDAEVFGDASVYGNVDYATICGFGREQRNTTFFRCKDNQIRLQCGCFYGTIEEFRKKVKETHGERKYAKEYLLIADLMEYHFSEQ